MERVAVIGAGSWGTALAIMLADKGVSSVLWTRRHDACETMSRERENRKYLPGFRLPEQLEITADMKRAVAGADCVLLVVPSHGMRHAVEQMRDVYAGGVPFPSVFVTASKGIENSTLMTMTEVICDVMGDTVETAVLSGPSFAVEVADRQPTAVTVAVRNDELGRELQHLFATEFFRVYLSHDIIGLELGGAVKNVLAIAAGICDGMGLGTNTRAALITRGLAEMSRLGVRAGAQPLTFAGLGGLGDLVLTCTGALSRNRKVGLMLGQGQGIENIMKSMTMVAEGVRTAKSLFHLARRYNVQTPVIDQVYRVLYEGLQPSEALKELMARPPVHELYGIEDRRPR
jgi:glycerol-3-phosphate dehydrogenase (NAD(P)+)